MDDGKFALATATSGTLRSVIRRLPTRALAFLAFAQATLLAAAGSAQEAGTATPAPESRASTSVRLIQEAMTADQAGRLGECVDKEKAALAIEEMPRSRLHLASCESRSAKLVDALKDAQKALEVGIAKRDADVMKVARQRVRELLDRIPHVTFVPPSGVLDLSVTFDERPVPLEALRKKFSVDPGKHKVVAEGTVGGFAATFEQEYEFHEQELVTVAITLKPPTNEFVTPGQIRCMLAAKSQEDVEKCLPQNRKNLVVRLAADLSGYSDSNSVAVYTPAVNASIVSPTAGWNVGGNFLVDAVTAASPDLVASASPPFKEYRYAGGVTGGYKPGLYGVQGSASTSSSPDYASYTVGGRLTADWFDKLVTPMVGYSYSFDKIGRGPNNYLNNFNPLKGFLHTHEIEAGITFVLSPSTLLVVGGTASFERGDQSQPYRYVPTFDAQTVAPFVPSGATINLVNQTRLPIKVLEQLPTERDRFAVGARLNQRIRNSTLRIEQRFYYDTWNIQATTTDARYMIDLGRRVRVWPHARVHSQTGANFYQLAYPASLDAKNQQILLPTYRTGDRELSPLLTVTLGGGVRFALTKPEREIKLGLTITGDGMFTRFFEALYITGRSAIYGSAGFDVEF